MVQLIDTDIKTKEVLDWDGIHLVHFAGSSCSQKTRIFLNLKGIKWQSHPLNLARQENYQPWFLGINPRGLVPVLVHDGVVHIESNDILEYLDAQFEEPRLIPEAHRVDIVESLAEEDALHMDLRALTMRFVVPKFLAQKKPRTLAGYQGDSGTIEGKKDAHKEVEVEFWQQYNRMGVTDEQAQTAAVNFQQIYARLESRLESQTYLCGAQLTLLDIAWFIYTHRLTAAGYPFSRLHPKVDAWYMGLLARPQFCQEVESPAPLAMITRVLQAVQSVRRTTLVDLAGI